MHFVLYSEKSVNECRKAITERYNVKGTASKPSIDGWLDKNNSFSLSTSPPVIGKIERRTNLRARMEKESGLTVIRGDVPSGAPPLGIVVMFLALGLVAAFLASNGNAIPAILILCLAGYLIIILRGDDQNSDYLLDELMKTLGAKATPPKTAAKKPTSGASTSSRK